MYIGNLCWTLEFLPWNSNVQPRIPIVDSQALENLGWTWNTYIFNVQLNIGLQRRYSISNLGFLRLGNRLLWLQFHYTAWLTYCSENIWFLAIGQFFGQYAKVFLDKGSNYSRIYCMYYNYVFCSTVHIWSCPHRSRQILLGPDNQTHSYI